MNEPRKADWLKLMRLIVITSGDSGRYLDIAGAALASGCRAVQLREKQLNDREFAEIARELKVICDKEGALFFVNDRVDIALITGSSGIHLGSGDISVEDARKILPYPAIVGYSPDAEEDAREAVRKGADYLGVGPVYDSPTKSDAGRPIGIEGLTAFYKAEIAPMIAIGGINSEKVNEIMGTGVSGVAVSSAVFRSKNPTAAVRSILGLMNVDG